MCPLYLSVTGHNYQREPIIESVKVLKVKIVIKHILNTGKHTPRIQV